MQSKKILQIANEVIKKESQALLMLCNTLDEDFASVVNLINAKSGKIIFIGVGKSSHIAKKVASTFASYGTPAFFLHPTEASHGDLGMIQAEDILIAFSRSGESIELEDTLLYCKSHSIPVIAVTVGKESSLAKTSDLVILLPDIEEACTLGLAPTTSSVMMLALGDALAITCMEYKSFTKNDFKVFHPAGKLGLSLLKVAEIMHIGKEIPLVNVAAPVSEAILEMTRCRFGCVGITDQTSKLIGIFTDGDLRRNLQKVNLENPILDVMVKNPELLNPDLYAQEVIEIFKNKRIPSAFVCRDGNPIGILHLHDLLQRGFV
jgi:arabinose-5-phosphate isomerase